MSLLMEALKRAERDKHKADTHESAPEESSADLAVEPDRPPSPEPLRGKGNFPSLEWEEPSPDAQTDHSHPNPLPFTPSPQPSPPRGEGANEKSADFDLLPHEPAPTPATSIPPLAAIELAFSPPVEAAQPATPPPQAPTGQEEPEPAEPPLPRTETPLRGAATSASKQPLAQETTTSQRQQLAANILAASNKTPGRNRLWLAAISATALLLLAVGAFLYWPYPQLSAALNQGGLATAPVAPPPVAAPMATASPKPLPEISPPANAVSPQSPPTPIQTFPQRGKDRSHPLPQAGEGWGEGRSGKPAGTFPGDEITASNTLSAGPRQKTPPATAAVADQPPKEAAITIRRGTHKDQVTPALARAYSAFMAGNDDLAQQEYASILRQDGNNRDALLGMAAIALKHKQAGQAAAHYGKLLELDPADPVALAGLIGLQGQSDPTQNESRLKKVLTQSPQSDAAHFALGNLHAQQSRWAEAQQSYFRAYSNAPNNADYAFNLAISLDHLNQSKLALEYYQRALSQPGPANFDKATAQNRARELQQPAGN